MTNKNGRDLRSADDAIVAAEGRGSSAAGSPDAAQGGRFALLTRVLRGSKPPATADTADSATTASAKRALRETAPAPRVAQQLIELCSEEVVLLNHRLTPRVKPHIDHLVICKSGVWIVHSRKNGGRVATRKPMFGDAKLTVGGRERTDLLMNLERQVSYVDAALAKSAPGVPVRSAICFVDTEPPLTRTLFLGSYLLFGAPALAKHLNSDGPLDAADIQTVAELLEAAFPPA